MEVRGGDDVFSHSRLASFEDCPRKFHYRYVLRLPAESESIEAFLGKRVHEVLERLYHFTRRGLVPSLAKVLHRFRLLWDERFEVSRVRIAREGHGAELYRANGERCLTNHYRRYYPFDRDETLGVEEHVAFSLDEGSRYRVQGVIDRIVRARDEAIEIHDYKTSARVPAQADLDQDRQLAFYQMGVARGFGEDQPIRLVWHYLLSDQVRTSSRTPEELADLRRATIRLIDRIRAERRFDPRPGPLCRWCEYRELCPASAERAALRGVDPAAAWGAAAAAPGVDPAAALCGASGAALCGDPGVPPIAMTASGQLLLGL